MNRRGFIESVLIGGVARFSRFDALTRPTVRPFTSPPTFDVRDFGARGDGVSDDSAAIVRALAAAAVAGGTVIVPTGVYPVQPILHVASGVTLRGEGDKSILTRVTGDPIVLASTATHDSAIQDLAITGQFAHGVLLDKCSRVRVSRCHVSGATSARFGYGNGVFIVGSNGITIDECRFRANGGEGFRGADIQCDGLGQRSRDIRIENNDCLSVDVAVNILCYDTSGSLIHKNVVSGARIRGAQNHGYGILVYATQANQDACFDNAISDNSISHTEGSGIYLAGCNRSRVINNVIQDVANAQEDFSLPVGAIALNQSQYVTIEGNQISGAGRAGISLASNRQGVGHVTVRRNVIANVGGYGIDLRGLLEDIRVTANTVSRTNGGIGTDRDDVQDSIVVSDNILNAISARGGIKLRNAGRSTVERNTLTDCDGYAVDLTFRDAVSTAGDNVVRQTSASSNRAAARIRVDRRK
ncbi:MAG: hypothetical protein JWM95_5218 [Gemmatimonadetes bacterium]|nr:hypothetical protein [Gemmatimonadota bacterium]